MLKSVFLKVTLVSLILLFSSVLSAQTTGSISGVVVDGETGEPLPGVNVIVEGTRWGGATDLEGAYRIKGLPVGTYNLVSSYIGYSRIKIQDVKVAPNKVEKINFSMRIEVLEGREVVVTAKAVKNTEAALLKDRQKAASVSDAISAEAISQAGAGDAAEAMKQITGASVVGGKYVYVRGLGDRYTSTQLNGAELPSSDPYARSGSVDLIPSNLIDNIVTVKSFTPDKPGNFSGGTVDIQTKDFPDRLNLSFSTSTSFNTQTTFNDNFLGITNAGNMTWLGMNDGSLVLPDMVGDDLMQFEGNPRTNDSLALHINNLAKSFHHNMAPVKKTPPLNQSYAFSMGNQVSFIGRPLGYLASLTYNRSFKNYSDGEYSRWELNTVNPDQAKGLEHWYTLNDHKSNAEVLWGATLKTSYKLQPNHILSLTGLYNRNALETARNFAGVFPYDLNDDDEYMVTSQQFNERSLGSLQLDGNHQINALYGAKIDWKASVAKTTQDEPDSRYFVYYKNAAGLYNIKTNFEQERYFRYLEENRQDFKLNLAMPVSMWNGNLGMVKVGYSYSQKDRFFDERRFIYEPNPAIQKQLQLNNGDVNAAFNDAALGVTGISWAPDSSRSYNSMGIYLKETAQQSSNYDADQLIDAYYAMIDMPLARKLRFIGGARYETTDMHVRSEDLSPQYQGDITTQDVLPSASLIYNLYENMNFRIAYGRTLARPTFREISGFASYDFKEGDKYRGYSNLNRTLIDNYDARWEWFSRPGEIYAVSVFYKDFTDPIVQMIQNSNSWFSWRNVNEARTYGIEFEVRKRLDIIQESLANFTFGGNLTLIDSEIRVTADELRNQFEKADSTVSNVVNPRPFQGQSPYLLNLSLSYDNAKAGFSANVYYNLFGQRLAAIGEYPTPDIYEQPASLLNVSATQRIASQLYVKFSVKNLLDSYEKKTYEFKDQEYNYILFRTGRTFSIGLKYAL